jgi:hypothetical protein
MVAPSRQSSGCSETIVLEPFPFIVARGRSGTTLLRAMFDSHPDMAVPPESHFLTQLAIRRAEFLLEGRFLVDRFVDALGRDESFPRWGLDIEEVRTRLRTTLVSDYPDAIRRVFALYAEGRGKRRYAQKTPINIMNIPLLAGLFPESRFIHLIRDGRDVALSYLDTDFGVDTVAQAAIYWRRFVREGRRAGGRLGPARYREVRYEELLADPERTLRELCRFVDLPYAPSMLEYPRRIGELMEGTPHREHHTRLALPPTTGLRDWRREMDGRDVEIFEAIAGDLLSEIGYERRVSSPRLAVRWAALRGRAQVFLERVARRLRKIGRVVPGSPVTRAPGVSAKEGA